MAAGALDDPGRDGEPVAQGVGVVHQPRSRAVQAAAATAEQREEALAHPLLRLRVAPAEERTRRLPHVLEDVHDIEEDGHLHAGASRLRLHCAQLPRLSIDKHDPATTLVRVAPQGFVEHRTNDLPWRLFHARPDALVMRRRPAFRDVVGPDFVEHVGCAAHPRRHRIHGRDLRHPLAVALLARREPRLQLVDLLLGGKARRFAKVFVPHDDALAAGAQHQQLAGGVVRRRVLRVDHPRHVHVFAEQLRHERVSVLRSRSLRGRQPHPPCSLSRPAPRCRGSSPLNRRLAPLRPSLRHGRFVPGRDRHGNRTPTSGGRFARSARST